MTSRDYPLPGNAAYEALFELTSTPTFEVDRGGVILRANKAAARLVEHNASALVGTPINKHLGDAAARVLTTDAPVDVVARLDGERTPLRLFGTSRVPGAGPGTNRIVQVIRREGRAGLDADRCSDSDRLTLVDDVSHNLGTPLAIVAGYAETLAERWEALSPAEVAAATDAIRRHANRAVDELRGIQARLRALDGGTGTVPTNILLAWLRRMLAAPLAATGSVVVEGSLPTQVTVDASVARQALLSICQALLGADCPADELVVEATTSTTGTTFTVEGRGVGSLRDDHRSMLAVTTALVADAGGSHAIDEDGSIHRMFLPARGRTSPPAARIPVAIVEDDPDAAALVRASLRSLSSVFEVVADERTLRSGLNAIAETQPRILLLDQVLPDGHGTQVLDRIREVSPRTLVVVLSAQSPAEFDGGVPAGGADGPRWLEKGRVLADVGGELLGILAAS